MLHGFTSPRRLIQLLGIGLFGTGMGGCIFVGPIPTAWPDPEPVTEESIRFIRIGETTRDEVRDAFESWEYPTDQGTVVANLRPRSHRRGQWWSYDLSQEMWQWTACVVVYEGGGDCLTTDPDYRHYYVLIEFNDADKVTDVFVVHDDQRCSDSRVCYVDGYFLFPASPEADQDAKNMTLKPTGCAIYMYTSRDLDKARRFAFGDHLSGYLLSDDFFIYWSVAPGRYELRRTRLSGKDMFETSIPVECIGGQQFFYEYSKRRNQWAIRSRTARQGRSAIKRRQLLGDLAL